MSTRDLVHAIVDGDSVAISNAFETEMADRIAGRLDSMRQDVARNMFAPQEEVQPVEAEAVVEEETAAEEGVEELSEEQLDELKVSTLHRYATRAAGDVATYAGYKALPMPAGQKYDLRHSSQLLKKRQTGLNRAIGKLARKAVGEETNQQSVDESAVDEINELSKNTLSSYIKHASMSAASAAYRAGMEGPGRHSRYKEHDKEITKAGKRVQGIQRAAGKMAEDIEQVQEAADSKVHPDALHVSKVGNKYKVHAVGSNFSHGIKPGEHLSDTELDDFQDMGGKIKHVK